MGGCLVFHHAARDPETWSVRGAVLALRFWVRINPAWPLPPLMIPRRPLGRASIQSFEETTLCGCMRVLGLVRMRLRPIGPVVHGHHEDGLRLGHVGMARV